MNHTGSDVSRTWPTCPRHSQRGHCVHSSPRRFFSAAYLAPVRHRYGVLLSVRKANWANLARCWSQSILKNMLNTIKWNTRLLMLLYAIATWILLGEPLYETHPQHAESFWSSPPLDNHPGAHVVQLVHIFTGNHLAWSWPINKQAYEFHASMKLACLLQQVIVGCSY